MKKTKFIIVSIVILLSINYLDAQRSFRVIDRKVQVAPDDYRYLTFGREQNQPNNGKWSIEYWNSGLNFWKPWPTWNSGNYKMFISDGGYVGINMKPMDWYSQTTGRWWWKRTIRNFRLQIEGNAVSHGWYTWSDLSIKNNIEDVPNTLSKVLALEPKMYNYKKEGINNDIPTSDTTSVVKDSTIKRSNAIQPPTENEPKHYGLIADDVKTHFPNIVGEVGNDIEAVNYVELIPILVKAIQEQQEIIQNLQQEIVDWKGSSIDSVQDDTRLFQNIPNPFDGTTDISYYIDENIAVTNAVIEIRNIMGNLENFISLGDRSGMGQVTYDGSSLNLGYYIYTLKVNGSIKDSKMFLKEQ